MGLVIAHRIRWVLVWLLMAAWFGGLAFSWLGDRLNLVLFAAIAILIYELLAQDGAPA